MISNRKYETGNKSFYKQILTCFVWGLLVAVTIIFSGCSSKDNNKSATVDPYYAVYLPSMAKEAEEFVKANHLNKEYCILVDYSLPSGKPRVFLWSFLEKKIIFKAHTMHGPGGGSTPEKAVLGNVSGSNCSAPGHFRITRFQGATIRPSFRLDGLDADNGNAFDRGIMLHGAWLVDQCLEDNREYFPIDKIWCAGCVTTSTDEMSYLEQFINKQSDLMLLWSFQSQK